MTPAGVAGAPGGSGRPRGTGALVPFAELWVSVQGSRGALPRVGTSMMDLSLCDGSAGETAGLLDSVSRFEDTWPMEDEEEGDRQGCESQKHEQGGSDGSVGLGVMGARERKPWPGGRHASLRELCTVPAPT